MASEPLGRGEYDIPTSCQQGTGPPSRSLAGNITSLPLARREFDLPAGC